jgi:transcriptional regulator with XRE-family HTH domain
MALFFDGDWFNARLAACGLSQGDAARVLGLDAGQIADVWKDQRELTVHDVRRLADLLGAPPAEVASRAGVSTPVPVDPPADIAAGIAELSERLNRIERAVLELKALLLERRGE